MPFKSNPCKTAFHSRLHAERKYDEYKALREYYRGIKIPDRLAWMAAAQSFPAPEGQPHEIPLTQEIAAALDQVIKTEAERGTSFEYRPMAGGEPVVNEVAPAQPTHFERATKKDLPAYADAWTKLEKAVPRKKTGKLAMIDFWFDYAKVPPDQIDPLEVPTRGCIHLLRRIQSSDAIYDEFIRNIWSKTIPSLKQIEQTERKHEGDGVVQIQMLDDFLDEVSADEAVS